MTGTLELSRRWFAAAVALVVALSVAAIVATARPARPVYVAIGGSMVFGEQPSPTGKTLYSRRGYPNDLVHLEAVRWPGLEIERIACPGIRATRAAFGGGRCTYPAGSLLNSAVAFVKANPQTVLVTIDLGYNDLWSCFHGLTINQPCINQALGATKLSLRTMVARLKAAGPPGMKIVGLEHYNPFLADWVRSSAGKALAEKSVQFMGTLNHVITTVFASAGEGVADVPGLFGTLATGTTVATKYGRVPVSVAHICDLTFKCSKNDDHPTNVGYLLVAKAVVSAL